VRIEIDAVEFTAEWVRFRVMVPDRNDGRPRPLEFTVQLPPRDESIDEEAETARNIQAACAQLVGHELAECILNRAGIRVIDPHPRVVKQAATIYGVSCSVRAPGLDTSGEVVLDHSSLQSGSTPPDAALDRAIAAEAKREGGAT
jgi:hypothetical protein